MRSETVSAEDVAMCALLHLRIWDGQADAAVERRLLSRARHGKRSVGRARALMAVRAKSW